MKARGFTLIESLIGLVLLSLGMLGAWAMLLSSLRSHGDALYRAAATHLLRDMGDRILANPAGGALYDTRHPAPAVEQCAIEAPCDVAQQAAADLAHFASRARALFPTGASARIEYEPAIGPAATDRFHLVLAWSSPRDAGIGNAVALALLAQPVAG
jgi:type IV pilus modification protein PilV